MDNVSVKELKGILLPIAEEIRAKLLHPGLNETAKAALSHAQAFMFPLLRFLDEVQNRGECDMEKLKSSLSMEVVKLSEIAPRTRESVWRDRVLGEVERLRKGEAAVIDPKEIRYTHLSTLVANLKKQKALDDSIKVLKRGDKFYLARV